LRFAILFSYKYILLVSVLYLRTLQVAAYISL